MLWILFLIVGAILTAGVGAFFRANPFSLPIYGMVGVCLPITILTQVAFAQAFTRAPVFFVAWFCGTAACSISAFFVTYCLFKEKFTGLDILAIATILIGAAILARGS